MIPPCDQTLLLDKKSIPEFSSIVAEEKSLSSNVWSEGGLYFIFGKLNKKLNKNGI